MEKILAGGANTDGKEIAAFEQKASFKIRVVRNAYRFCSVIFTALLLCLAGCGNEWDASKDLTIGQDWLEEADKDTADRLESDLFREDDGSEPQSGWRNTADGAPFGEKDLSAQSDTAFSYGYSQLSGDEEQLYREILNSLISYQEETELSVKDPEMVERVFRYVMADHPEIFYADGYEVTTYRLGTELRRITFTGTWTLESDEVLSRRAQLEAAAALWLEGLPDGTDDFEKAKYIYDALILRTEYEQGSADSQTICSVLLNQRSVCQGYAKTFQYLCQLAGIPAMLVTGDVNGEGHAWNIVEINGEQYYVDATNGDQPAFLEGGAVSLEEHKTTIYDYLCPFPQEYEQLYTASDEFPLPACTATDCNFYVLNQACFDTYDEQQIYDFCCMRLENGAAVVRFKFTSQEAFDEACQQWIQEGYVQKVAEYYLKMYGLSTVEYHYGILDNLKTIYFMF